MLCDEISYDERDEKEKNVLGFCFRVGKWKVWLTP